MLSFCSVSISNSLIKTQTSRDAILTTKKAWDFINADVNSYFKAQDINLIRITFKELPASNRFYYVYKGAFDASIKNLDYNTDNSLSELTGLTTPMEGTDAGSTSYYFYDVRITGYPNGIGSNKPRAQLEVFVKQQGVPINN